METAFPPILEALAKGEKARAEGLALAALDGPVRYPAVLQQVKGMFRAEGRLQLRIADVPEAWRRYGGLLARQGLVEEGLVSLELALALDPRNLAARIDAGTAAFGSGDLNNAQLHFLAASELDPRRVEPLASLAAIAARQSRVDEALDYAERAIGLDGANVTAHLAWARAKLASGDAAACIERVGQQLASVGLVAQNRVALLDLRAEAYDAIRDYAGAFRDYEGRNTILRDAFGPQIQGLGLEAKLAQVQRLNRFFSANDAGLWSIPGDTGPDLPEDVGGLAFLVGFPRSGTTLLEKALAGLPQIASLEEVDTLAGIGDALMADDKALALLPELAEGRLDEARAAYWERVRAASGGLNGRVVLDKMPLYTVQLPVIARLFPQAKLLFAIRDPRDVVLSCFRRRFRMNAAMYEFLTIAGAAAYYDETMRLGAAMESRLALERFDVVHERIVADFEGEMRRVVSFLDVEWDDAVHGFADRARLRPNTPSDPQLVGGLTSAGIGQWRNYQEQLGAVLPLLEPWVRHFGY